MREELDQKFIDIIFEFVKAGGDRAVTIVEELTLRKQITMLKTRDYYGWCILHWAIYHNQDQLAKILVDKYLKLEINTEHEDMLTGSGWFHGRETALHIALKYANYRSSSNREELILYLLDKGANPEITDQNGMNALDWAVKKDLVRVITALMIKFDDKLFLKKDSDGNTALHKAVNYQYRSCIEILSLYSNGKLLNVSNNDQQTPLNLMRNSDNREISELGERILKWHDAQQRQKDYINNKRAQINNKDCDHQRNISDIYIDPISLQPITNPVVDEHGCTYEERTIKNWLKHHDTCPVWNKKLVSKNLVPNYALKQVIERINSPILGAGQNQKTVEKRKQDDDMQEQKLKKAKTKTVNLRR